MALSPAERQRRYRLARAEANSGEGERRLNTWLNSAAALALKRLAAYENATQRAILERLIVLADDDVMRTLHDNEAGFEHYLNRTWPKGTYRPETARDISRQLIFEKTARHGV